MDKQAAAERLARKHKEWEPEMESVYLLISPNEERADEPIKLLEVVNGTRERGIEPIGFAPDPKAGLDYFLYIVEVSPRELEQIESGVLDFGKRDWRLGPRLAA